MTTTITAKRFAEIWDKRGAFNVVSHTLTAAEDAEVNAFWQTMSGDTSWMDAFHKLWRDAYPAEHKQVFAETFYASEISMRANDDEEEIVPHARGLLVVALICATFAMTSATTGCVTEEVVPQPTIGDIHKVAFTAFCGAPVPSDPLGSSDCTEPDQSFVHDDLVWFNGDLELAFYSSTDAAIEPTSLRMAVTDLGLYVFKPAPSDSLWFHLVPDDVSDVWIADVYFLGTSGRNRAWHVAIDREPLSAP